MAAVAAQEHSAMSPQETFAAHLRNCLAGSLALIFLIGLLYEPSRQAYHRAQEWQEARNALSTQVPTVLATLSSNLQS